MTEVKTPCRFIQSGILEKMEYIADPHETPK